MAVITLKDLSKLYGFGDATTVALEDVSLNIEKGEFVAVMGPSGSGKSTLMNIIGLLDRPTHGMYRLDGRSVERLRQNSRARARRDKIGFVFQSPSFLPRLTVIENVALPLAYKGKGSVKRLKAAHAMLDRVGLADRAYYLPRQLSGGQLQRATIARALINEPNIIIADEPTGNLDSASSRLVMELISEIHKMGNTVLMVTHNPELTRYASRILYMYDGSIAYDEQKLLGEVALEAEARTALFPDQTLEEADLAGVSALMGVEPEVAAPKRKPRKTAKKTKSKAKISVKPKTKRRVRK
jgi:putative ABC transport system ATP-binding protein